MDWPPRPPQGAGAWVCWSVLGQPGVRLGDVLGDGGGNLGSGGALGGATVATPDFGGPLAAGDVPLDERPFLRVVGRGGAARQGGVEDDQANLDLLLVVAVDDGAGAVVEVGGNEGVGGRRNALP